VLADFVEVTDPAWEKACEEFLHEELEYVVVGGWNGGGARGGIDARRSRRAGHVSGSSGSERGLAAGAGFGRPSRRAGAFARHIAADQWIRAGSPRAFAAAGALLPDFRSRRGADAGDRCNPDCYFLLQDGVSYHGHAVSGGRKTAGGPLALKRELRELSAQVETRQRQAEELAASLAETEGAAAALAEDLESSGAQQTQEKDALALDHEQRKLAEENARRDRGFR
jgi:chromosome segregation protein